MYGGRCSCCRAADDLSLDHIRGDGSEHRARYSAAGRDATRVYRDAIATHQPDRYRVLCRLCNASAGQSPDNQCRLNHSDLDRAEQAAEHAA
jgi:hypothetical protein